MQIENSYFNYTILHNSQYCGLFYVLYLSK